MIKFVPGDKITVLETYKRLGLGRNFEKLIGSTGKIIKEDIVCGMKIGLYVVFFQEFNDKYSLFAEDLEKVSLLPNNDGMITNPFTGRKSWL